MLLTTPTLGYLIVAGGGGGDGGGGGGGGIPSHKVTESNPLISVCFCCRGLVKTSILLLQTKTIHLSLLIVQMPHSQNNTTIYLASVGQENHSHSLKKCTRLTKYYIAEGYWVLSF